MEIQILKAEANEEPQRMADLLNTVFQPEDFMAADGPISKEAVVKMLNNSSITIYIASDKESNQFVGFVYLLKKKSPEFLHRGFIQAMGVISSMRGKGVGNMLLTKAFEEAKVLGIEILTLEVVAENIGAIRLYEQFGMRPIGTIPRGFRKDGKDYDVVTYYTDLTKL